MKSIRLKSYGKVNLTLDVLGKYEDGFHQVEMIMQAVGLHDEIFFRWWEEKDGDFSIDIHTNKYYLPVDESNIAYRAASLVYEKYYKHKRGRLRIDIKKNIPVAAGMAGGSSNCAAVILALNSLWDLNLSLESMLDLGGQLGSDVPFLVMANGRGNAVLHHSLGEDLKKCGTCVVARGRGTQIDKIRALDAQLLISKPPISVSTKEVYGGLKLDEIVCRPKNNNVIEALKRGIVDVSFARANMYNVLESYTLQRYDIVKKTKEKMQELCKKGFVMMSGSGPTIFGIVPNRQELEEGYKKLKSINKETYITRTMV